MINNVDLKNIMNKVSGKHCQPMDVAIVNNQIVRMAYIDGEFHWHKHNDQDELFYLIKGKLLIQLKKQPHIILTEGQMTVIPQGIEHCPKSIEPSYILLFEPISLKQHGD
jgi:quercetin dioxygenase-like cupin family protein